MVCGILAGQPFASRLVGDESLSRRPLNRVVVPLTRMGASIETTDGFLPMTIAGGRKLRGIDYELPVASAQVKTAILFAGLYADGVTRVKETTPSRNHTELALQAFGAPPLIRPGEIEIKGGASLSPGRFSIPGDISSAAFFIGAAAFLPGSELVVENVGLNPSRAAFLDALEAMGADIEIEVRPNGPDGDEPQGRIVVRGRELQGVAVPRERVPALIDELPILAVVAAFASGATRVEGASELRVKESDRLKAIVLGLRALGVDVTELEDGFEIRGTGSRRALKPASLRSFGDHRMVMAWAVAALGVEGECAIDHLDQVKISYPGFWQTLDRLVC
jgi:3-phosphoshikimate 1-carboxyvinyltransferase